MNKEQMISIKDSPQRNIPIPPQIIEDVSVDPNSGVSSKSINSSERKAENSGEQLSSIPEFVNQICVEDLAHLSETRINLNLLHRLLRNFQEIKTIYQEVNEEIVFDNQIFTLPDFSQFDESRQRGVKEVKSQSSSNEVEEVVPPVEISQFVDIDNVELIQFDIQTKIKLAKLKKYYNVLNKKIRKFLYKNRHKLPKKSSISCKFCQVTFSTGRELGGHISRMHTGQSQSFKHKITIHQINQQQRNRRKHWKKKNLKPKNLVSSIFRTPEKPKIKDQSDFMKLRTRTVQKPKIQSSSQIVIFHESSS